MEQTEASSSTQTKTRVVLALIGSTFSHNFVGCLMNLIDQFSRSSQYSVIVNQGVDSNSSLQARISAMTAKRFDKKPFESVDYDVMVMLDHNILFSPKHVFELVETCVKTHPVVFSYHRTGTSEFSSVVKEWSDEGMKPTSMDTLKGWAKENESGDVCMPISHAAFGLFAARKEALDTLEYPYFQFPLATLKSSEDKEIQEFVSEDIVFCLKMKEAGFAPVVKTDVVVGKELSVIV